jgi:cytosine deaminase
MCLISKLKPHAMKRSNMTPFFSELARRIATLGGIFNAHLHIDRTGTYDETLAMLATSSGTEVSALSLSQKHAVIPAIHASPCYEPRLLGARVQHYVDLMCELGTTRADTVVDVTIDRVARSAFDTLLAIRDGSRDRIDFRVGAYSPLGFRDDEPQRWNLLRDAAAEADFLGSLPERDDPSRSPGHIGFEESCRRVLLLAAELGKPVHIHVDQQNHDMETGSECVVRIMRELGLHQRRDAEPLVWLVHAISPSTYEESRFQRLVDNMVDCSVGIICCPSAALSMRQYRPLLSPTYNSIARVLDFLAAGIHVRLGSDNICDITSPAGTPDLIDEVFVLCNAIRYYDIDILAKLAAGRALEAADRQRIQAHLAADAEEVAQAIRRFKAGMM